MIPSILCYVSPTPVCWIFRTHNVPIFQTNHTDIPWQFSNQYPWHPQFQTRLTPLQYNATVSLLPSFFWGLNTKFFNKELSYILVSITHHPITSTISDFYHRTLCCLLSFTPQDSDLAPQTKQPCNSRLDLYSASDSVGIEKFLSSTYYITCRSECTCENEL